MADEITGYAIAIDGLTTKIKAAENKFDDLAKKSEETRTKIVAHFKEMGDNGVDYFIKKIEEAKKALGKLGNVKISLTTNIATQATQDADAINKLLAMMSQLSDKQIQRIGTEQGKLDMQKKLNEIRELRNAEDERARALQANNNASMQQAKVMQEQLRTAAMQAIEDEKQKQTAIQQTAVVTKQQSNDALAALNQQKEQTRILQKQNRESINDYKIFAEQQKTATMQAVASEKEKQIAIQQTINEIKRMAKAYKMMPTAIRTTGVNNLLQQSQGAVTINQRITAYKNLQNAVKDLDRTEQGWQTNLQKLNTEIERQKRELAALGVSLDNTKRKKRDLAEMATYLAKRMAVLFGINQIKDFYKRLIDIRGEFELENKSLQILLQNKVKANELWAKTVALAVESPFRVKELVSYTKQLAAYRIESDQLYDTTKRLADVSAGLGVDMQRLILAYGQVKAASFLRGTELRQFTEAGIPMLEELAKYFTEIEGKAVSVGDVFEMISKRMVKFSDVEEVFRRMTDAGGVFYNMQKEQAQTLKGQISNLHDRIDLMMNDIGKSHDTLLKNSVAVLGWIVENWKAFAWAIQLTVEAFAVYKVSALIAAANTKKLGVTAAATSGIFDKLKLSIRNIGKAIKDLNLNPWVLGITAVLTVAYELWSAWDDNKKMLENINAELDKMREKVSKITADFNVAKVGGNLDEQRKKLQELVNVATGDYGFTIDFAVSDINDNEVVAKFVELRNKIDTALAGSKDISTAFANEDLDESLKDYSERIRAFYDDLLSNRDRILNILSEGLVTASSKEAFSMLSEQRKENESEIEYFDRLHEAYTIIQKDAAALSYRQNELILIGNKRTAQQNAELENVNRQIAVYKQITKLHSQNVGELWRSSTWYEQANISFKKSFEDLYARIGDLKGLSKEEIETRIKIAVDTYGAEKGLSDFQKQVLYPFLNEKYNIEISVDTPKEGKLPEWVKRFNDYFAVNNAEFIKQIDEKNYNVTAQETLDRYKNLVKEREKEISEYLKGTPYMTGNKEFNLTKAKNELAAYKEAVAWFSRTEDKNNKGRKDTKDWWSELVKVIGDAHKEFVKLNEQLDKADAKSLAIERFKNVYAEVAKNLKVSLKPLQDFNLETEDGIKAAFKYLRDQLPASAKNARLEIEKQLTDIKGEARVKVATEANVELKQQIEDMFSGYELQLELDKMGFPPEMANLLFNVKPTNLESIRKAIDEKYAEATSQADIKNRDELLKKLSDMEDKQMKENFKKYSEYLIKAQNERVKIKLEELNKIAEVEKTFSMTATVAQKKFGVNAEQWRKYKESGDWSQSGVSNEQIANITAYASQLNLAAERVKKSLQDETAKKMAKLDWQDFKGSEMYIEIFQNLENASTKSINAILERLQTLKGSFKDLSATEVKDIVTAMTKAEEELENRRPTFKALFTDLKQYIALSKTRNQDEALYAELQKQSVENSQELAIARNNLASAEARYRKLAADPNADKGELEDAKVNMVLMQKQADGLENNQKRINKKLDETNNKLTLWQKLQKNIGDKLKDVGSGLEGISTLARAIGESFGELSVEAEKVVQAVSDLGGVMSGIGDVVANPKSFSSWVGLAATATTFFVNLFNNDAKWQRQIEEQERLVNRLQRAYEELTETIEGAYSIYAAEQANLKARYNLESQINARRAQINAEMQKKKKDKDQIIEWENEIKDLQEQIDELARKQREEMGGFGTEANYKSAAQQFVDAWLDAYKQTGSGLDALQDTFNDFYENMVKKQLLYRGTQKILEPLLKLFDNAVADYTVTEDEANELKDFFAKNVKGQLDELYTSLADIFGIGKNVELSDLQKGIQNITEAQAAAIESYLNSIRFYVSAQLETIKAIQSSIKAPDYSPIVGELKAQTSILRDIYDTLSSVVGRGGSVHSGAYLKVYM